MTRKGEKILADAMELPVGERSEVITQLLNSLDAEQDTEAEAAWTDEIRRRREDVRTGRVTLIPWAEIRDELNGSDPESDMH